MQERPSGTQEWPEKTSKPNRRLELLAKEERNARIPNPEDPSAVASGRHFSTNPLQSAITLTTKS